ncbi:MAG: DUF192 domain-containing protein [Candidatus Woesearchaeota archaeon]
MITNAKTRAIIAKNSISCKNIFSKATGLMFRTKVAVHNTGWIFDFSKPATVSITMWFVFYPIDILFLDSQKKIIEIAPGLKPFTNYSAKKPAHYFIELQAGTVKKKHIRLGQTLKF